jgi:hypothetical protein
VAVEPVVTEPGGVADSVQEPEPVEAVTLDELASVGAEASAWRYAGPKDPENWSWEFVPEASRRRGRRR